METIDRQLALSLIDLAIKQYSENWLQDKFTKNGLLIAKKIITELPASEKCRAKWIPREYDGYADGLPVWDLWECSHCGHEHSGTDDTLTAYCPDCGYGMYGGENHVGCDQQE